MKEFVARFKTIKIHFKDGQELSLISDNLKPYELTDYGTFILIDKYSSSKYDGIPIEVIRFNISEIKYYEATL